MPKAAKQHTTVRTSARERQRIRDQWVAKQKPGSRYERNRAIRNRPHVREFMRIMRNRMPVCLDPFGLHWDAEATVVSEDVHHIEPLCDKPEKATDPGNVIAVCRSCHGKLEGAAARGVDTTEACRRAREAWEEEHE